MSTNFMSYGGQSRNKNDFNKIIIPSIAEENADFRSGNQATTKVTSSNGDRMNPLLSARSSMGYMTTQVLSTERKYKEGIKSKKRGVDLQRHINEFGSARKL